ncbi:heavy metal-associated isoprenylated plant protein 9-like [Diospyros lotus]|uniref:heavy metal-associated isoprenylated plant protein 9-like n=1 Tax=Diospyros lotus TaxID=55363 RepID=UPI002259E657|nr:heavy metal-associated isoprenylated plant protein 9-like [Diospyros lotus]
MLSREEQSNTPPPSEIRNNSDVEGDGKAEKATVEKLLANPNHTNSNESLVRTAEMTVVQRCNCEGCIKETCKIIKNAKGCHDMSIDKQKNKVTVKGTMDMLKALANRVSKKLKNRTVLIVPLDDDGNKSNKPPVTTAELKMAVPCVCDGHLLQIRKIVENTKGFHSCKVSSDEMGKAVVSVTGTMDVINAVKEKLEKKLKTSVEITTSPPILGDLDHGGSENKRGRKQRKSAADG